MLVRYIIPFVLLHLEVSAWRIPHFGHFLERRLPTLADMEARGVVAISWAEITGPHPGGGQPPASRSASISYAAGQYLSAGQPSTTTTTATTTTTTISSGKKGGPTDVVALYGCDSPNPGNGPGDRNTVVNALTTTTTQQPAATTGGGGGGGGDSAIWVKAHNDYRKQYGAKDLTWDEGLAVKASNNAKQCNHQHSNAGENIAWNTGGELGPQKVVDMWMSEAPLYDWKKPRYDSSWGHFSQCIWKNTAKVGCYTAKCGSGVQVTCEYDPAGNYIDAFAANVKPKGTAV